MNLGSMWNKRPRQPLINRVQNKAAIHINYSGKKGRSFWGTPTWHLFHMLAVKTDPIFYNENYVFIWNFIKNVCNNLPCPFCKKHAIEFVNKINLHEVSTKEKLKIVLHDFHNKANVNSGSPQQPIEILDKYARANVKIIFELFEDRFFKSYIGTRQFNDWTKNKFKLEYYAFYNVLRTHFV